MSCPGLREWQTQPGLYLDRWGNYNLGINNPLLFPELQPHFEVFESLQGINVTLPPYTPSERGARLFLSAFQLLGAAPQGEMLEKGELLGRRLGLGLGLVANGVCKSVAWGSVACREGRLGGGELAETSRKITPERELPTAYPPLLLRRYAPQELRSPKLLGSWE